MSEFDNIQGVEGWHAKLRELLSDAREAAESDELAPRLEINELLMLFIEHSSPNSPEINALDDIANEVASALLNQVIDDRLKLISEGTGKYLQLAKSFQSQAEANEEKAASIRLEGVIGLIDSATKTIEKAKEVRASLTGGDDDKKLGKRIQESIDAVEGLRRAVAKLT